jgi:succinate dehydrogenase/fumarate reductase flavoprotein subunit
MGEATGRAAREAVLAGGAGGAGMNGTSKTSVSAAPVPIISDIRPSEHGDLDLSDVRSSLRSAMWRNAGIERSGSRLNDVADMIDFWARYTLDKIFDDPEGWQTQNMLLVAALVARSAAWRKESRGCHWRSDFPEPRDEFRVHDVWRRGSPEPTIKPVEDAVAGGVQ